MLNNSANGDGDSPKSICGNRSALEFGSGVSSKVRNFGVKLSLKPFKSYYLLILILGFF